MKTLIKSAIIAGISILAAGVASAQVTSLTQNVTHNVIEEGEGTTTFTFNQFDSSLGSLTAVDLIIQSSTLQGSFTVFKNSIRTFSTLSAELFIPDVVGYGSGFYSTTPYSFARTPSGTFAVNNTTQLVSVNGTTQSLISNTPVTLSINSGDFSTYIGSSTLSFNPSVIISANSGASFTLNGANLLSPTTLTLRYTYNDPSAVPEPGQVAASLLLLGGIGGYVFIKRRRKPATAAA